jgi:hypothetical protein
MSINPVFCGHGIWLELKPIDGLKRYASYGGPKLGGDAKITDLVDRFIKALQAMKITSVWFEIFNRFGTIDPDGKFGTTELLDGLKYNGINAIPWGYCLGAYSEKGVDPKKDNLGLARSLCEKYKLDVFCADIEPGNNWDIDMPYGTTKKLYDTWSSDAIEALVKGLVDTFSKSGVGISSFANIDENQQSEARNIIVPVTPLVSFCAPQIYWNKRDPLDWARKSLLSWRNAGVKTNLIATTQSYWELSEHTASRTEMEAKLEAFLAGFHDAEYGKIVGLNWYHAGKGNNSESQGGMSQAMIDTIAKARLDQKPYLKP